MSGDPVSDQTVQTEVLLEQGQWTVYLLVIDPDAISRRRLSVHLSERAARVAASSAQRGAHRRRRPLEEPPTAE